MANLISQGAEAKIFLSGKDITKHRTPKSYRHPTLDSSIRTTRTKSEAKILTKANLAKVNVPNLIHTEKYILTIQHIIGDRLSLCLNSYPKQSQIKTMQKLGKEVAKLHQANIIHSDLTTSNLILQEKTSKLFLIDFGLSYISTKIEDKAVDLHLIKQALEAKHYQNHKALFNAFQKTYKWQDSQKILERLTTVESRGRYKH